MVLRARHVSISGGELTVRNAGAQPCWITNPYHCSVFLTLRNARNQPLTLRKARIFCDPAEAYPVLLGPGDSIRYALESPRDNDEEELRQARTFELVYQGHIAPQKWDARRARRVFIYTLRTSGPVD